MSLRLNIALRTAALTGVVLGLALAVDLCLVTPWIASLVPGAEAVQDAALARGAAARRLALVWLAAVMLLLGWRVADRALGRPLQRLAAEVTRRRVSGPQWAGAAPSRIDEIGVIAREFGRTLDELKALRGSAARAEALGRRLRGRGDIDFAVRRLAAAARRLGVAAQTGDERLAARLQGLADEVDALRALTREADLRGPLARITPGLEPAPGSPGAPAASPPDPRPEAGPC